MEKYSETGTTTAQTATSISEIYLEFPKSARMYRLCLRQMSIQRSIYGWIYLSIPLRKGPSSLSLPSSAALRRVPKPAETSRSTLKLSSRGKPHSTRVMSQCQFRVAMSDTGSVSLVFSSRVANADWLCLVSSPTALGSEYFSTELLLKGSQTGLSFLMLTGP